MKTGINFKQSGDVKFLHVHPETLLAYMQMLPKNDAGWITFRIDEFEKVGDRNTFAQAVPIANKQRVHKQRLLNG